jgi:hypothetical protein
MPIMIGVGAGAGLLKHEMGRKQREKDRQLDADTARFSPWTGMKAKNMGADDPAFNSALQGGMAGLSMGQGMDATAASNDLMRAKAMQARGGMPVE